MDEQNVRGLLHTRLNSVKSQVHGNWWWVNQLKWSARSDLPHPPDQNLWRYQFDQAWIFLKDGDQWWSMMFNGD